MDDPLIRLLDCPICLQPYDTVSHKPMSMPCGHSLCRDCSERLKEGTKFPCLNCDIPELPDTCDNCLQMRCPFCRHFKALLLPTYDYCLLDQMEEARRKGDTLDRETNMTLIKKCWEEKKRDRKDAERRKIEEKIRELEEKKKRILEEAAEEAKKEETTRCSSCLKTGFSDDDLRLCLECTDPFLLRQTDGHIYLIDKDKGRQVAVCSHCTVTSDHRNHKNLSLLQITRLAQFEKHVRQLLLENTGVKLNKERTINLKKKFMKAKSDEEQENILNILENMMMRK